VTRTRRRRRGRRRMDKGRVRVVEQVVDVVLVVKTDVKDDAKLVK
jgi:TATA-binding protein-associated factor Taf7